MKSESRWLTRLIVLVTLGLVLGPVVVPREVARWYLAAAHVAFRKADNQLGASYLERAIAWDDSLRFEGDFWIAQIEGAQNPDQHLDLLEQAVKNDPRWAAKAFMDSENLAKQFDFPRALRALKIAFRGNTPSTPVGLNQLAYYRALANVELDEALVDIDQAIAGSPPGQTGSVLDTKAWVLHKLQQNSEALQCIDEALKQFEDELKSNGQTLPQPLDHKSTDSLTKLLEKFDQQLGKLFTNSDTEKSEPQNSAQSEDIQSVPYEGFVAGVTETPSTSSTESSMGSSTGSPKNQQLLSSLISQNRTRFLIDACKRRLGELGHNLAVLHFHRLRILEALQRDDDAAAERQWLEDRGVPVVDELF